MQENIFTMKKLFTLILLLPAIAMQAETVQDTTFVYGNKQIVVSDTDEGTNVAVLDQDGDEFRKTSETKFVDGQEVTQVYVTSPFLPKKWNINRKAHFYSHIPWFSYGFSTLSGGAMHFNNSDGMHLNSSKSWEFAIAPLSAAIPFNSRHTFGVSFGMQFAWVKVHFKEDYALYNNDGILSVQPIEYSEGRTFKKSYISYKALRFPVFLEYQRTVKRRELFATFGLSLEVRQSERARYKTNHNTITTTKDIHVNPIGVNLELQFGYAGIAFYMRQALTPLMKTSNAPKAYPMALGMAVGF